MAYREEIAVDKGIDNTISFLLEGYKYISNRTNRYNRNIFQTRLFGGKKCICMVGKDAAEVFYEQSKIKRHGATPPRVLKSFLGEGGVQTLDGVTHRHRKNLFMSLMTKEQLYDVTNIFKQEWLHAFSRKRDHIILYNEAKVILMKTALKWAGIPDNAVKKVNITGQLASLFESGGAIGSKYWRGRMNRKRLDNWMEKLIIAVRETNIDVNPKTALYQMAYHRNLEGTLLNPKIVSVEVLNILRPIIAIAVYLTFCALALHQFPEEREKLKKGTSADYRMFIQEVRRYYPFFPVVIGKVKEDFVWSGHVFKQDIHIMLDLYGTNHDPNIWEEPDVFRTERFKNWKDNAFSLIPQGGAEHYKHHRCAGEWLTMDIMKTFSELLVKDMTYDVSPQKLQYSMVKMPSIPKSGFVMENVVVNFN